MVRRAGQPASAAVRSTIATAPTPRTTPFAETPGSGSATRAVPSGKIGESATAVTTARAGSGQANRSRAGELHPDQLTPGGTQRQRRGVGILLYGAQPSEKLEEHEHGHQRQRTAEQPQRNGSWVDRTLDRRRLERGPCTIIGVLRNSRTTARAKAGTAV